MGFVAIVAISVAILSIVMLERQRADLEIEQVRLASSPVTLWRKPGQVSGPLVVVAHGYAGSRQMMQALSVTLARAGFTVAAFDFHGHGRNPEPMDRDIATLDGATAQLVDQTVAVTRAARNLTGVAGPVALVGHSMATDIVIRAAGRIDGAEAVVAISMYSDAVRPDFPERLLIVSGAREGRLREVALDRLRQITPNAQEGRTVSSDGIARRAVAAPHVGHVGVLYSPETLGETRDWIAAATGGSAGGHLSLVGPWVVSLLVSLVTLAWPLSGLLGPLKPIAAPRGRTVLFASISPVAPAAAAAIFCPPGALGLSAFGALAAFLGVWGTIQLVLLLCAGCRSETVFARGLLLFLLWGLALFAPALDRYGAAFLPTGPRLQIMGLLLLGTIPFCFADALLARIAGWLPRLAARLLPLATLLAVMLLDPPLGIAFTVLPVMVLFWCVYGLAGRWIAARTSRSTSGLALGIILAWAIAASTPLVAA